MNIACTYDVLTRVMANCEALDQVGMQLTMLPVKVQHEDLYQWKLDDSCCMAWNLNARPLYSSVKNVALYLSSFKQSSYRFCVKMVKKKNMYKCKQTDLDIHDCNSIEHVSDTRVHIQ